MASGFLGVTRSFSNKRWKSPSVAHERIAYSLVQKHNISPFTAFLLAKRGIESDVLESFLSPKIKNLMPDPKSLRDMEKASIRLLKAIKEKEKICIFADYDVDGTTCASILQIWLSHFKVFPEIYIPDRITEGYGPNPSAMEELSKRNNLIICVDCGTVAHHSIQIANSKGTDVLVLDHHMAENTLPPAVAIINPKRQDESGELEYLCAAGVVFLFLVSLNRILREKGVASPDIMNFLDLVALATVADVVPLVGLNRALVSQGLKMLAQRNRPGLVALIDEANIKTKPTSYHLSYLIAPRINAAGRLSDAKFAVKLLTSKSQEESIKIARELNELNVKRRSLEDKTLSEAIAQVETQQQEQNSVIWVADNHWHPGVLGIIAARLREKYSTPSLVFSIDSNGLAIGSARSVPGVDIAEEIKKLSKEGLIVSGGGHSMAAGIKLHKNQLVKSMALLSSNIKRIQEHLQFEGMLEIDSLITTKGATLDIVEEINLVGPFGAGNPQPLVAIANCQIKYLKIIADKHIKFVCEDATGKRLESIFFNSVETESGRQLLQNNGASFNFCGTLDINDWAGYRRVVFQVEDVAEVSIN